MITPKQAWIVLRLKHIPLWIKSVFLMNDDKYESCSNKRLCKWAFEIIDALDFPNVATMEPMIDMVHIYIMHVLFYTILHACLV